MGMMAYNIPQEIPRGSRRVSAWAFVPLIVPFVILIAIAAFATLRWHPSTSVIAAGLTSTGFLLEWSSA